MDYKEVNEAKDLPGLRLALTIGVPGPWSEAAKYIFQVKGIDFVPVAQRASEPNEDLAAWTGHRNAPVAVLDDNPPKTNWADILALAERIQPEPRLVPEDFDDRILMFGLANEICGEDGFGWNRRLQIVDAMQAAPGGPYNYQPEYVEAGAQKTATLLGRLTACLKAQKAKGSDYFIGNGLTALDLYWASFSQMLKVLPPALSPAPDFIEGIYKTDHPGIVAAQDPILFDHRMMVFEKHVPLPLEF